MRCELKISTEQRALVLCAALLHDIGHGPFSHAFETVTKDHHERRTLQIIRDSSTEVNSILRDYHPDLPDALGVFFQKESGENERKSGSDIFSTPDVLISIVSSQLDGDRFDYLLRDSYSTGVSYGQFDVEWILQHLIIDEKHQRIVLDSKGLHAAEAYIFARYHMYRSVYYHKATRAGEVMLKLIFKRLAKLIQEKSKNSLKKLIPDAPPAVIDAFSNEKLPLSDYLLLDDSRIYEFFHAASKSKDSILSELGEGLLNRRLYKTIDTTNFDPSKIGEFVSKAKDSLASTGVVDYYFQFDTPADTPYKPFDPDEEQPAQQIFVNNHVGKPEEIGKQLDTLGPLRKKYSLTRYYFPEKYREGIARIAQQELKP